MADANKPPSGIATRRNFLVESSVALGGIPYAGPVPRSNRFKERKEGLQGSSPKGR